MTLHEAAAVYLIIGALLVGCGEPAVKSERKPGWNCAAQDIILRVTLPGEPTVEMGPFCVWNEK